MLRKCTLSSILVPALVAHVAGAPLAWAQSVSAPPAPVDGAAHRAEELREKGAALCKAGQRAAALTALKAAWSAAKTPQIAADLGACEIEDGQSRNAAEHLDYALRGLPAGGEPGPHTRWKALFDTARAKVGALKIHVSVDDADVLVGNRFIGSSPLALEEVFVDPGEITVYAKKSNGGEAQATVRVATGGSATVLLKVADAGNATVSFDPVPGPSIVPVIVLGGVAVAAGAVGFGFLLAGSGKGYDADTKLTELKGASGPVPCPSATGCSELKDLRAEHDQLVNRGAVFMIAGGAALAGAVGYGIWAFGPSESRRWRRTSLTPVLAPGGGGVWAQGAF